MRTAINRFYYAAFCEARDFLIKNIEEINCKTKLKKQLTSKKGMGHGATSEIFNNMKNLNQFPSHKGKTIS
ncbi:hypothetical protein [Methanosphaera sp.]